MIRSFHHREFHVADLVAAKRGRRISLCLPARDEEATVGAIVQRVRRDLMETHGLIDEILVVDDESVDATARTAGEAGARVITSHDLSQARGRGKGGALWNATALAAGDLLVFCDADVRDFDPRFVVGLAGPLLLHDDVSFVKAFYERAIDGTPRGGGRVTELTARPVIAVLFPDIADIVQPLAGEFAAPREVLEQLPFAFGYGVDIGLLIDAAACFGVDRLAQVDLGQRVHRNRRLDELGPMATIVLQTALQRAGVTIAGDAVLRAPGSPPAVVRAGDLPPLCKLSGYRSAD